ncbi:MAG: hypothetical protein DUD39_09745 [Coriobacteriaceae bacterium]|nr:MAG: hypothetical protein DUD39_09745 [Coriobacteriaceae bacterium]
MSEKGIESRKASIRSKVEHPFLIVKRRFDPLRKCYRRIEKSSCMLESLSPLQTLPMCIFCRQAAPPGSQSRLICLGAFLRCMGQDRCKDGGFCTCWMGILPCLSRIPAAKRRVVGPL